MARKFRDPNARLVNLVELPVEKSLVQIRESLVDIWGLVSPFSASQTADYTLSGNIGHERVICANTTAITITLNPKPKDLEEFTIKRAGTGAVTIDGNGNTMDGKSTVALKLYDGPNGIYTDAAAEWSWV